MLLIIINTISTAFINQGLSVMPTYSGWFRKSSIWGSEGRRLLHRNVQCVDLNSACPWSPQGICPLPKFPQQQFSPLLLCQLIIVCLTFSCNLFLCTISTSLASLYLSPGVCSHHNPPPLHLSEFNT
jgi:hypothetical protein